MDQATRDPAVEQAGLLQVFDEERQLTERCDRRARVPLDIDTARVGIDWNRSRGDWLKQRLFTRRVS